LRSPRYVLGRKRFAPSKLVDNICMYAIRRWRIQGLILSATFSTTTSLQQQWLALTTQTFKLTDLKFLAASIECPKEVSLQRLLVDAATGCSLLQLDGQTAHYLDPREPKPVPTFLQRCDWAGPVMARGSTPENMIKNLIRRQEDDAGVPLVEKSWTLTYLCLSELPAFERRNRSYSSSTLLCAVAQAIRSP